MEGGETVTGLNMVRRQPGRWGKFKGRVKSWFGTDTKEDSVDLPKIIVTSPQENNNEGTLSPTTESEKILEVSGEKLEKVGDNEGQNRRVTENGGKDNKNEEIKNNKPVKTAAEKDDLARAHEDVIAQMREAMLEARGGSARSSLRGRKDRNSVSGLDGEAENQVLPRGGSARSSLRGRKDRNSLSGLDGEAENQVLPRHKNSSVINNDTSETTDSKKPPVPPTKAVAVAKIRQAIADARRNSEQQVTESEGIIANSNNGIQKPVKNETNSISGSLESSPIINVPPTIVSSHEDEESVTADKKKEDIINQSTISQNNGEITKDTKDSEKAARSVAIKAKLRETILSAATEKITAGEPTNKLFVTPNSQVRRSSSAGRPTSKTLVAGQQMSKRHSFVSPGDTTGLKKTSENINDGPLKSRNNPSQTISGRETIWKFFEEGRKKGTCRTCGYIVSIKHNTGGLTRHLSLVHQKEYRDYTSMMEINWTHGMMEKNLNMKLPKNI